MMHICIFLGIDLFYSGAIASDIVQTSDDSLTKQDIADYNVSITLNAPSHIDLPNDFRLETFAAPTYGPLLLFVVNRMASVETSTNISFWLDQFKKVSICFDTIKVVILDEIGFSTFWLAVF
jgi:gamma-glutamyltranspeptidase